MDVWISIQNFMIILLVALMIFSVNKLLSAFAILALVPTDAFNREFCKKPALTQFIG